MKGISKSAIVAAALSSFLSPEGADRREAVIAKRLDRLSHQFERLERDQTILIETLALYVRYYLAVSIPVHESQQDAARAQGRARFAQFVEQLGRRLQRGNSLVKEVFEEIRPGVWQLLRRIGRRVRNGIGGRAMSSAVARLGHGRRSADADAAYRDG